ncbi:MAG TPA: L,D-transpeptidase family protein [Gemmatimonadaceae bacterium]|nr:L,D-transpeptidase family protein [Gemmatimonadaceae bacterium]
MIVNVAAFRLDAVVPDRAGDRAALSMKVIVGEARRHHETPVFLGTMREVVFRPYWDVPASIARQELVPAIRRDPSYLRRQDMEIVRGGDDDAVAASRVGTGRPSTPRRATP